MNIIEQASNDSSKPFNSSLATSNTDYSIRRVPYFSLEWDIIVVFKARAIGPNSKVIDSGRALVHAILSELPFVKLLNPGDADETLHKKCWKVASESSAYMLDHERAKLPVQEQWVVEPLKLFSRSLSSETPDWRKTISRVLDGLHQALNVNSSDFCIYTNSTCNLSVTVQTMTGDRIYQDFKLTQFFVIVTAFERVIERLHSVDRLANMDDYQVPSFVMSEYIKQIGMIPCSPDIWLQLLANFTGLCSALGSDRSAYRLQITNGCILGIEFRQHRGTLDADEVIAWVGFVTALFGFPRRYETNNVVQKCFAECENSTFWAAELMAYIEAPAATVAYYQRRSELSHSIQLYRDRLRAFRLKCQPLKDLLHETITTDHLLDSFDLVQKSVIRGLEIGNYGEHSDKKRRQLIEACAIPQRS